MTEPRVYTLAYRLKNRAGEVVDTSEGGEPLRFVSGSGAMIPGIEKAVAGRSAGECLEVTIPPDLAYGERDPALVRTMRRAMFQGIDEIKPGMKFQTNTGDQAQVVQVVEVRGEDVVVDANHPLSGLTLFFDLEILEARKATDEEVRQGQPLE